MSACQDGALLPSPASAKGVGEGVNPREGRRGGRKVRVTWGWMKGEMGTVVAERRE